MDKEVVHTHKHTHTEEYYSEGNPDICNKMDGPEDTTLCEMDQIKTNTARPHLYVESKNIELAETE